MSIQVNSEAQRTSEVRERHRREVRQQIILPVVLTLIVFIILPPLGLLLLTSGRQVGIVASFATVMVLVPVVVLCVVPYALLIVLLALSNKLNRNMPDLLRTARNAAYNINQGTHRVSHAVTVPVMAASKRLAWIERFTGGQPPHAR